MKHDARRQREKDRDRFEAAATIARLEARIAELEEAIGRAREFLSMGGYADDADVILREALEKEGGEA